MLEWGGDQSLSIDWLIELLKGVGLFFLNPLLYFFVIMCLAYGYVRIKRERKTFYTRIEDIHDELKFTYTKGLISGILLSIILFGLGISVPFGMLLVMMIVTAVLSLTFRMNYLSSAFTLGISIIIGFSVNYYHLPIVKWLPQLDETNWSALAVLLGLLITAEGILAYRTGHLRTSPSIVLSSRGLPIGQQISNRSWLLPLFFLVPGNGLESHLSWWPVFSVYGHSFLFIWIPYFVGFGQTVQGSLPSESMRITSKRVSALGLIILAIGISSLFWAPLVVVAVVLAIIGKVFLSLKQRINDQAAPFYFSKRDQGLMILGIIPDTPAKDLQLEIGEIITKVNGVPVKNVSEFYEALQKNRAYVKLEVIGLNGEVRFNQRASYEGEHHELGILFVKDEEDDTEKALV